MQSCWQVKHGGTFVIPFCCRCHRWLQLHRGKRGPLSPTVSPCQLSERVARLVWLPGYAPGALQVLPKGLWHIFITCPTLMWNLDLVNLLLFWLFLVPSNLHHLSCDALTAAAWSKLPYMLLCGVQLVSWSEWARPLSIWNECDTAVPSFWLRNTTSAHWNKVPAVQEKNNRAEKETETPMLTKRKMVHFWF